MNKTNLVSLAFAGCVLFIFHSPVLAFTSIGNDWEDYYNPCQTLVNAGCASCHMNGTDMNPYGLDMKIALDDGMTREEAFAAIELFDSDMDGYTNGQEIVVDCTFPGDDTDHGVVGADQTSWGQIKVLFR